MIYGVIKVLLNADGSFIFFFVCVCVLLYICHFEELFPGRHFGVVFNKNECSQVLSHSKESIC